MKTASETRQIHSLSPIRTPLKTGGLAAKKIKLRLYLKPDNSKTLAQQLEQISRQQWVSNAAYFKAEARNFAPGHEMADLLEAEQEFLEMVVQLFMSEFKEDGDITIIGLQQLAKAIGIADPERLGSKLELIRQIQSACNHSPCFRTKLGECCPLKDDCQWRAYCQKLQAEWQG